VDQRVDQLEGSLRNRVRTAIADARPELLAAFSATVDTRIAELDGRLAELQTGVGRLRGSVNDASTELAALRQSTTAALANQSAALRAEFAASLRTAVDDVKRTHGVGLETVRAEIASERARVNDQLADVRRQIPRQGITRDELLLELATSNDRLRTEVLTEVNTGLDVRIERRLDRLRPPNRPDLPIG
jgi:hypothetical protein